MLYSNYLSVLERWPASAAKYLYTPPGRPEFRCYGTGYNNWGVQTQQKAFSAFAVLAADPAFSNNKTGMHSDKLLDISMRMLRFSLESHIEGNYACLDGTKWGHTWISTLGLERMMHGIDAIREHLSDYDRELLKKVMLSESNWLVDFYHRGKPEEKGKIKAGTVENNDPESNIWNGAHLLRTAMMYPDEPRAGEYYGKGVRFLVNGISVPSDEHCKDVVEGKPVSEWFAGANFFESFSLNHHGYLNVGYMVICLSNLAMLHFSYRLAGKQVPSFLYRHVRSLWNLVKLCTFPDGRLCRIGGDTRIRYCYCQDYCVPAWLMMEDLYGDPDCIGFEKDWLDTVTGEMKACGDGSFLSARCGYLASVSPLYYTRLESDRAATLSMGAYWRRMLKIAHGFAEAASEPPTGTWHDEYHGACMQRGRERIASFCWRAAQPPQGLCLPVNRSNLAEWRWNCAGNITGLGRKNYHKLLKHEEHIFKGGFITFGQTDILSEDFIAEGQNSEITGKHSIVFTSLPDDGTVIVMQRCIAPNRTYINEIKGLLYNVSNDLFNEGKRKYYSEEGCYESRGCRGSEETVELNSRWMNIDDCLGIVGAYGSERFTIYRPGMRQAGLKLSLYESKIIETGLWADEICFPYRKGVLPADPGTVLLDTCCVIMTCVSARETKKRSGNILCPVLTGSPDARAVMAKGADEKWYLQAFNCGHEAISFTVQLKDCTGAESLTGKKNFDIAKSGIAITMGAGEADVLKVEFQAA